MSPLTTPGKKGLLSGSHPSSERDMMQILNIFAAKAVLLSLAVADSLLLFNALVPNG
ncbi:hypothetical protein Swit_1122 [Rhizorhabdus wittichii RW1]|uniref:Uncharacterized protein n=1 Tax=Rhizorhabdus wittichii (strain DSM 6014 / CCUG 31198 / JCM 15750 / NBRC 105917 / EY 4224 / RW1) TaxID=392499 RepID=A0A9J9LD89_RHIWR|nr:hypothetical protein Swit_1122 [Rhizorhabdus wittichii RW1]